MPTVPMSRLHETGCSGSLSSGLIVRVDVVQFFWVGRLYQLHILVARPN